jgi:signal transduction histidine kinase
MGVVMMAIARRNETNRATELERLNRELRTLTSQLSLAEEKERRRIAIELHDRTNETLVSSIIRLATLAKSVTDPGLASSLNEICQLLRQLTQATRLLMFELSPPSLYYLGLEAAIKELADRMMEKYGIRVSFIDDARRKPVDIDVKVLLFQAVRELLTNVAKHAQARAVSVSISGAGGNIRIVVQDDGVGFDNAVISNGGRSGGFGLYTLSERLRHMGGRLEAESGSWGTRITLIVPFGKG